MRKSKKRKFVLVGKQWGNQNWKGNRNLGLNCKLGEVALDSENRSIQVFRKVIMGQVL